MTIPGTANGSIDNASNIHPPRSFQRTTITDISTPSNTASSIAVNEYCRLLIILGITRESDSAFSKFRKV